MRYNLPSRAAPLKRGSVGQLELAMRTTIVTILVALVVMLVVTVLRGQNTRKPSPQDVSRALREKALTLSPRDLGISIRPHEPFAIVMDMAYPEAVASLLSSSSGDASIYFSNGGGIIGGIGHEDVKKAAQAFVLEAAKYSVNMSATREFPYPAVGKVRFYVRTPEAVVVAEAPEAELGGGKHPLSPLFFAGQNVITRLRESTSAARQTPPN